jgi:hypothetical protein
MVRDKAGSYDPILTVAMVVFVVGGGMLLLLGRYPDAFGPAQGDPAGEA